MKIRIHRGAHEVGGSCVEVESSTGARILLDLGRPLSARAHDDVPLPDVRGLREPDPSLLGIVVSHPHADHIGLIADVATEVPVYLGREATAILAAAAFFSPLGFRLQPAGFLVDRTPLTLGPFTVTPYLADHSAFDSYSLLVEVDGRRLFYTGDLRAHGRKAQLFERLLADPPPGIDVLMCEGTSVRADGAGDDERFRTETELEDELVALAGATAGAVAVFGSAQNLDRLVTAYRAVRRIGRQLVVDLYAATVAAASRPTIPQAGFPDLRIYVPQRQRIRVKQSGEFARVAAIRGVRIFDEELATQPGRFVHYLPTSTAAELLRSRALGPDGLALWSMWDGYLTEPSGVAFRTLLQAAGVPLGDLHTSGHASVPDLQRLAAALNARTLVPIHTEAAGRFPALFDRVVPRSDGEWWAA